MRHRHFAMVSLAMVAACDQPSDRLSEAQRVEVINIARAEIGGGNSMVETRSRIDRIENRLDAANMPE